MLTLFSTVMVLITAIALSLINVCRGDELLELFCVDAEHCEKFRHADITVTCVEHYCHCSRIGDTDEEGVPLTASCTPKLDKVTNIIGGPCPCSQPHAECEHLNGICYCADKYMASGDRRRCLPKIVALNADCENDEQCSTFDSNGECARESHKCTCKQGFVPHGDQQRCVALLGEGESCSNDKDCHRFGTHAECAASLARCVCGMDFVSAGNRSACLPGARWHTHCSEDAQCRQYLGPGGKCATVHEYPNDAHRELGEENVLIHHEHEVQSGVEGPHSNRQKCICDERYFLDKANEFVCARRLALGEYCRTQHDCYQRQLSESEQTMNCVFGECACKHGYKSIDSGECFLSWTGGRPKPGFLPLAAAVALSALRCRVL